MGPKRITLKLTILNHLTLKGIVLRDACPLFFTLNQSNWASDYIDNQLFKPDFCILSVAMFPPYTLFGLNEFIFKSFQGS